MAYDQIEYCGECPNYSKCLASAKQGRLKECKASIDKKEA